jgi:glycosyltransferase involved in cell wall biosynthesis
VTWWPPAGTGPGAGNRFGMRVLIATEHYPPWIGGAHRQMQLLAHGLSRRGHEVTVATPWSRGLPWDEPEEGVRVHRLRQLRTAVPGLVRHRGQRYQPPFPDPVTIWELRRLLRSVRPDIVHAHGWIAFSVAVALAGDRTPLLISAHDYGYFCATRGLLRDGRELCSGPGPAKCPKCAVHYYGVPRGLVTAASVGVSRRLLVRKIRGLHSVSTFVHDAMVRHLLGVEEDPPGLVTATIPSFQEDGSADHRVNDPRVGELLARLPEEPFILFVGAFRRVKGLETLFAAYERLEDPPPLVLIGTFERDTPRPFPADAVVLEDVPHAAVMAAWDRAMFGVMPSLIPEPFGLTVLEPMTRGRTVIGTRPGGHADIVDADSGLLVPQGDTEALARAMQELIGDPERRTALGRAARERAAAFDSSSVVPRFERLYEDVVAKTPSARIG